MILKADYKPLVYLGLTIVVVSIVIAIVLRYLLPFAVGMVIALMIDPIVNRIESKLRIGRGIVVMLVLTAIFSALGYLTILAISRLTFELGKLINILPNYTDYLSAILSDIGSFMFSISDIIPQAVLDYLLKNWGQIITYLTGFLSNFYTFLVEKLVLIPSLLVFLIFTFLSSYFFAKDKKRIIKSMRKILPQNWHKKLENMQLELFMSVVGLIKAQIILVMISTIITIAGFYILKVDYALTLGIICGILDILPIFGPSIIFIPWAVFSAIVGNIKFAIALIVLYLVVVGSRQVLQAKVIGTHLGLNPIVALISIYVGIKVFGFLGLFIGPMVAVIVRAVIQSGFIPPLVNRT
ncbi:sporulation integral membrane protein YtvI [Thermosediminibacter litoriperuensis]|uniref:Sporulation integral membrane protein YtvI n=1 Tax=Thermosediminibacter litoriperuensis TaxID=291989 RepID=A0A5S5AQG8_9FIRM|nr:sporulation integral membrane protein YtvI [Thermosediminibacter litoriperuensis]TYP54280.1 sporulation integral membrane protein YtvI [Thermosediminibacter litoriperuensis]